MRIVKCRGGLLSVGEVCVHTFLGLGKEAV